MTMNATTLTILAALATGPALPARADAPAVPKDGPPALFVAPDGQAAAPRPGALPSEEAIRAAIRATLDEMPLPAPSAAGAALSGTPYSEFARKFSEAAKPHCMGPDPLKHQPPGIGKVKLGGLLALPFWSAAILRGKCNWRR